MANLGFVKLPRELFQSALWPTGRFSRCEAYLDLLRRAAFHASTIRLADEEVHILPGELFCSAASLARSWGWGDSTLKEFLSELVAAGLLTRRRAGPWTVLRLRYDVANSPSDGQLPLASEPRPSRPPAVPPAAGPAAERAHSKNYSLNSLSENKENEFLECGQPDRPRSADERAFVEYVAAAMRQGGLHYDSTLLERLRAEFEAARKAGQGGPLAA